jgi:hypothetical protein
MMDRFTFAHGRRGALAAALVAALALGACGGGSDGDDGGSTPPPPPGGTDSGTLMIGLTDADGDFMRYAVEIEALTLERDDGAVVEALPNASMIDLAQFVDVTELFSTLSVPLGTYSAAHFTIDYSEADIAVERDGETVDAVVVDANGDPLTTVDVEVNFDEESQLVVAQGVPAIMQVDFDLAASNTVDLTTTPVTVTAEPFLLATVEAADGKTVLVTGPLTGADASDGNYTIDLRPFHRASGAFGEANVQVDDETTYEIDGQAYTGQEGLDALAALPEGTPTIAEVTLDVEARTLHGSNVLAGSSVPGADLDAVEGWVTSRDGNVVHVRGATFVRESGELSFGDDVDVTLAADVTVRQLGNPDAELDASAISVGQRVTAMGTLNLDDPELATMEASIVRLKDTHVSGDVTEVQSGAIVVDLEAVDVRDPSNFDYTGTGTSAETDADPDAYEIDTGSLGLEGIEVGTPVRVFGFVAPFGAAPPDFLASSVTNVTETAWRMDVRWPEGSTAAFATLEAGNIVLDLTDPALGEVHYLRHGGVFTDLFDLAASPTITGPESSESESTPTYGIWQAGVVQVYDSFDSFVTDLTARMDGSVEIRRMHAVGAYDEGTNSFAANRIAVQLE